MATTKIFELESGELLATLPEGVVEIGVESVQARETVEKRALAGNVVLFERTHLNATRKFASGARTRIPYSAVRALESAEAVPYGKYKMVVEATGETFTFRFASGSPVQATPIHEGSHPAPDRDYHSLSLEIMEI